LGGTCSPIVHNGSMFGSFDGSTVFLPTSFDVGNAFNVFTDIGSGTYNNSGAPCTGDCAADLLWNLGSLAPGASESFTVVKERVEKAPEPETLALLGLGLVALQLFRRRARMTA
jgi:hypothetical protein